MDVGFECRLNKRVSRGSLKLIGIFYLASAMLPVPDVVNDGPRRFIAGPRFGVE